MTAWRAGAERAGGCASVLLRAALAAVSPTTLTGYVDRRQFRGRRGDLNRSRRLRHAVRLGPAPGLRFVLQVPPADLLVGNGVAGRLRGGFRSFGFRLVGARRRQDGARAVAVAGTAA